MATWVNAQRATPCRSRWAAPVSTAQAPIEEMPVDEEGLHRLDREGTTRATSRRAPPWRRGRCAASATTSDAALAGDRADAPVDPPAPGAPARERGPAHRALAAMIGGIGVILVGFAAPEYTFGALRRAPLWSWFAGIGGAAVAVGCAFGWTALAETLGEGPTRCSADAVSPALFEELAFRGRSWRSWAGSRGSSRRPPPTGSPWARRSTSGSPRMAPGPGSLWPGILLHLGYNATPALTAARAPHSGIGSRWRRRAGRSPGSHESLHRPGRPRRRVPPPPPAPLPPRREWSERPDRHAGGARGRCACAHRLLDRRTSGAMRSRSIPRASTARPCCRSSPRSPGSAARPMPRWR